MRPRARGATWFVSLCFPPASQAEVLFQFLDQTPFAGPSQLPLMPTWAFSNLATSMRRSSRVPLCSFLPVGEP
eukprot:7026576-Lingulodinium_polyedra.AAC.1